MEKNSNTPSTLQVVIALILVYIFWGGTYLGIKLAVVTIPPFIMAGTRFLVAGIVLYFYALSKGAHKPTKENWIAGFTVSFLILLLGNGSVTWASKLVPSNISAIIIATVPMWLIIFNWLLISKQPPAPGVIVGVIIGLFGIGVLVFGSSSSATGALNPIGIGVLIFAAMTWSLGSLYSKFAKLPQNTIQSIAVQMLCAAVLFYITSLFAGDWKNFDIAAITLSSLLGLLYLIFFGSIIGYSAYIWLIKNVEPAIVSTYAFVNPAVAVFAGWAILGETLSPNAMVATGIILLAVIIITLSQARQYKPIKKAK